MGPVAQDGSKKLREYAELAQVGEGSYATVYRATHQPTGRLVAIKKCVDKFDESAGAHGAPQNLRRELELMRAPALRHERIVQLLDTFVVKQRLFIVLEYIPGGNLLDLLQKHPAGLPLADVASLLRCLLSALAHLHAQRVIHRDVKPENLLVAHDAATGARTAKLCDFGEAVRSSEGAARTQYVSTRWYRAPELLSRERSYGAAVDVWATGCVGYEMLAGSPLFTGESDAAQAAQVAAVLAKGPQLLHSKLGGIALRPHNRGVPAADHAAIGALVVSSLALAPVERPSASVLLAAPVLAAERPSAAAAPDNAAGASLLAHPLAATAAGDSAIPLNPFAAGAAIAQPPPPPAAAAAAILPAVGRSGGALASPAGGPQAGAGKEGDATQPASAGRRAAAAGGATPPASAKPPQPRARVPQAAAAAAAAAAATRRASGAAAAPAAAVTPGAGARQPRRRDGSGSAALPLPAQPAAARRGSAGGAAAAPASAPPPAGASARAPPDSASLRPLRATPAAAGRGGAAATAGVVEIPANPFAAPPPKAAPPRMPAQPQPQPQPQPPSAVAASSPQPQAQPPPAARSPLASRPRPPAQPAAPATPVAPGARERSGAERGARGADAAKAKREGGAAAEGAGARAPLLIALERLESPPRAHGGSKRLGGGGLVPRSGHLGRAAGESGAAGGGMRASGRERSSVASVLARDGPGAFPAMFTSLLPLLGSPSPRSAAKRPPQPSERAGGGGGGGRRGGRKLLGVNDPRAAWAARNGDGRARGGDALGLRVRHRGDAPASAGRGLGVDPAGARLLDDDSDADEPIEQRAEAYARNHDQLDEILRGLG